MPYKKIHHLVEIAFDLGRSFGALCGQRQSKRGFASAVLRGHVCAARDEEPHRVGIEEPGCDHQRRLVVPVSCVHMSATVEEALDTIHVTRFARREQVCVSIAASDKKNDSSCNEKKSAAAAIRPGKSIRR